METIIAVQELLRIFKEDIFDVNCKLDRLTEEIMSIRANQVVERKPEYYGKE